MGSQGSRRWTWAAGGVAAVVVLAASYVLVDHATRHVLEVSYAAQLQGSLRLVATDLQSRIGGVADALREIAGNCGGRPGGSVEACREDLERMRRQQPRLVTAALVFDGSGRVVTATPSRSWRPEESALFGTASRKALAAGSAVVGAAASPEQGRLLFVVVPASTSGAERAAAVGVVLDIEQLARGALDTLVRDGRGMAFLAAEDGLLIAAAGEDPAGTSWSLAGLLGDEEPEALRRPASLLAGDFRPWTVRFGGRREGMLGTAEAVRVLDSVWVVGAMVPTRWVSRAFGPLLLGGALLLVVVLAGAVVALAGWRGKDLAERGAARDAERWREVAERRQREGRWRGLADNSPSPLACLLGTQVVAANQPAVEVLGSGERDRVIGMDFLSFVAEGERGTLADYLAGREAMTRNRETLAVSLVTGDDRRLQVELSAVAVRELEETLLHISWQEMDGRRAAEALLETIAHAAPLGLVFTDTAGLLKWSNAAFSLRTGYDPARFHGRPLLPIVEATHRRAAVAALARARRGRLSQGHVRIRCSDGELVGADFQTFPVSAGGQTIGALFVASEVGAAPPAAPGFPSAARDRALSLLGTSLAHRLSNNLQALLGVVEELEGGVPAQRTIEAAQRLIGGSVEDLRRFAAFSRSGSGARRALHLVPLVDHWVESASRGLPPSVRLTVRHEAGDDRAVVDGLQLTLWLDVALAGALSAMERDEGAVEVSVGQGHQPGTVRLAIADTGLGAPEPPAGAGAEREHLSSRRTAQALAELIATRHGGRSGSHARTGIGGRVWIELPGVPVPVAVEEAATPARRVGAVLIADDEEMVRATLAAALREAGHEVVEAGNGREAVETVLHNPSRFALVVLDIVMPVMDGREALRHLREQAPGVPVVVSTGYDPSGDDALAAAGVLIKPFTIEEFLAKVSELLGESPGAPPGGGTMAP
jgi:PAS domain S-box-containing protein